MAGNLKILLVDDNPMILGMLRHELAELAPVTIAANGADALVSAIEQSPDLIISDYNMPGLDGRQLVERLKTRPATSRIPVILLATRADISEKLRGMQDSVEDFVEKPFFVKEAITRVKRVLDKIALEKMAKDAPGETVLRGSLAQMNVIDLLQSLELGRKTCSLAITNANERCELYFTEGQINHAVYGELKGDEAVYKVLTWTGGNFQIDFEGQSSEQTVTRSTQGLLMEGLRLLDEANRDAEEAVDS
ncbi:MAG TPA: response regulator [Terriglobales bacterium]|nr:response regulator [Terriglobales bacterium]